MDWNALLNTVVNWVTTTGVKLLIAFVIMLITFKIINAIAKKIERSADKKNFDKTIMRTVAYIFIP